jgi:hypothetical protein
MMPPWRRRRQHLVLSSGRPAPALRFPNWTYHMMMKSRVRGAAVCVARQIAHMWPFCKKHPKAGPGQSSQEFLKSYVPPPRRPVANPLNVETVCPLCFLRYGPGNISADYSVCPDCSGEAIDIEVEPLDSFLHSKTPEDFDEIGRT